MAIAIIEGQVMNTRTHPQNHPCHINYRQMLAPGIQTCTNMLANYLEGNFQGIDAIKQK